MSSRRGDIMAIVMGKLTHKRDTSSPINLRKRCIKKNFEGIHDRFQKDFKFRDSQLRIDRTEAICIQMDEVAQKIFTYRMLSGEYERYIKELVDISQHIWTKCTDETPIQTSAKHSQRCTVFTVSLEKSDLHRFLSGSVRNVIRRLLHPAHHGGSGTIPGGAQKNSQKSQAPLSS